VEHGAQGDVDDRAGLFFDDDGVYPQGLGVEGILELETQDTAVGEKGKLEAVTEGGVPINWAVMGCIAGDGRLLGVMLKRDYTDRGRCARAVFLPDAG
jgi:hypothetical protein